MLTVFRTKKYYIIVTVFVSILVLASCTTPKVTPETALQSYLQTPEPDYNWKIIKSDTLDETTVNYLLLTSQRWRDTLWTHQLAIIIPKHLKTTDASLLFITGGKNDNGKPRWRKNEDKTIKRMQKIADANKAPVAVICQVPNQPLYGGKTEDELISYTLHKYKETKDFTWPLLFPMTKSAVKAMDAVQEYFQNEHGLLIESFVVSGASKRGWTTWLTGASDPRVIGIAPMVIDVLNMSAQMDYQVKTWGDYSPEIQDYVNLGITDELQTENGKELTAMIDPYSYRDKITMPKLLFIGTNDPYWPVDAVKNYFNDLVGSKYIHYVANVEHGLGDGVQATQALSSFYAACIASQHPNLTWETTTSNPSVSVKINTDTPYNAVKLWTCTSPDRDFRNDTWTSKIIDTKGNNQFTVDVELPQNGFLAFYIDIVYNSLVGGEYSKSTRMFVADSKDIL